MDVSKRCFRLCFRESLFESKQAEINDISVRLVSIRSDLTDNDFNLSQFRAFDGHAANAGVYGVYVGTSAKAIPKRKGDLVIKVSSTNDH